MMTKNVNKYECQILKGTVKAIEYSMLQGFLESPVHRRNGDALVI